MPLQRSGVGRERACGRSTYAKGRPLSPKRALALALALLACLAPTAFAQTALAQTAPTIRNLEAHELAELSLSDGRHITIDFFERLDGPRSLVLPIDGELQTIVVEPHSQRGPGFRVLVADAAGRVATVAPPPPQTLIGRVEGYRRSAVAGSFANGHLRLLVRLDDDGRIWAVEPLRSGGHALYERADELEASGECGMAAQASMMGIMAAVESSPTRDMAEIALDADYELYLEQSRSVDSVVNKLETIVAGVRTLYEDQLDITYEITSITVRTEPDDPYASSDAMLLLDELRSEWTSGSMLSVQRDVTYLFTGRNLAGSTVGIAYLDRICDRSLAYGLTQTRRGTSLSTLVSVTAHELGHVWSAPHCNGTPDCGIMCSSVFSCSGRLDTFGALARDAILRKQRRVSCLDAVPIAGFPTLNGVFPTSGRAHGGDVIELHGTDFPFDEALRVTLGGVEAEVLTSSETLVTAITPPGEAGRQVDARVEGETYYAELDAAFRYDVEMGLGDRVTSSLSSFETERFYFDGLAGAELTASVNPKAKGMSVGLRVVGPNEEILMDVQGKPGRPASLKKFPLAETGEHRIEAHALDATTGEYQLKTKGQLVKSIVATLPVSRAQPVPTIAFSAVAGTVAQLRFQVLKPRGAYALIDGEPADLFPMLAGLTGPAGPVPLDAQLEYSPKGAWVRVKNLVLPDRGDYTLELGGLEGSVGHGKATVKLKAPRSAKQTYDLD